MKRSLLAGGAIVLAALVAGLIYLGKPSPTTRTTALVTPTMVLIAADSDISAELRRFRELANIDENKLVDAINVFDRALRQEVSALRSPQGLRLMELGEERLAAADEAREAISRFLAARRVNFAAQIRSEAEQLRPAEKAAVENALVWYQAQRFAPTEDLEAAIGRFTAQAERASARAAGLVEDLADQLRRQEQARAQALQQAGAFLAQPPLSDGVARVFSASRADASTGLFLWAALALAVVLTFWLIFWALQSRQPGIPRMRLDGESRNARNQIQAIEDIEQKLAARNREIIELRSELASRSDAARSKANRELAAMVKHELNTPLGFVRANLNSIARMLRATQSRVWQYRQLVDLLQSSTASEQEIEAMFEALADGAGDRDETEMMSDVQTLLEDCETGIEQISTVVRELGGPRGGSEGEQASASASEAVETVLKMLQHKLGRNIHVRRRIEAPRNVRVSRSELNQVLLSLITNAAEAVGESGEIELIIAPEGEGLAIMVRDNGEGMDEEALEKAFDVGFTTKDPSTHQGVGLTLVKRILQQRGGKARLDSRPGEGSTVRIWLPTA